MSQPTRSQPSPRTRLLTSTVRLLQERGVAGTSLSDVVEHSGAPRGSLYHYFPGGKAQLTQEATRLAGDFLQDMLRSVLTTGDLVEAIDAFVDYWADVLSASDFSAGCPIVAAALGGQESSAAREEAAATFEAWGGTLADALRAAGLPEDRVDSLATLAVTAVEGAIVVARAGRDLTPLVQVGNELKRIVTAAGP